jgi:low affinity Fe/Cu permease
MLRWQHMNQTLPGGRIPTSSNNSAPHANGARTNKVRETFRRFSGVAASAVGSPWAFTVALAAILVWALLGPHYGYSDTWQLVINTGTTIVTFLMVFLIQNTQNRDARAIHLKLDELIKGTKGSRNLLVDLEDCTEEELEQFEGEFKKLRERQKARYDNGGDGGDGGGDGGEQRRQGHRHEENPV